MAALLVAVLATGVGAGANQSARGLAALTVPDDRLPPGCRLKTVEPRPPTGAQRGVMVISGNSEPNPLISRERRVAAEIRRLIDGAPPEPDGPPLMPRSSARWELSWAEDVVEAYRATYRQADGSPITVAAIQFNDARLATPIPPFGTRTAARGMTSRIVLGPTVVLVAASASSGCFEAIENYLRSVR
jgi:hypothetical protein